MQSSANTPAPKRSYFAALTDWVADWGKVAMNAVIAAGDAVAKMSGSADANPGLLPAGLGAKGGEFSQLYTETFERIVLGGQDIRAVLDDHKPRLQAIMDESGAPCWAPDAASDGPCPVE